MCHALGHSREQERQKSQARGGQQRTNNYTRNYWIKEKGRALGLGRCLLEKALLSLRLHLCARGVGPLGWGWVVRRHRDPHDVSVTARWTGPRWSGALEGSERTSFAVHSFIPEILMRHLLCASPSKADERVPALSLCWRWTERQETSQSIRAMVSARALGWGRGVVRGEGAR